MEDENNLEFDISMAYLNQYFVNEINNQVTIFCQHNGFPTSACDLWAIETLMKITKPEDVLDTDFQDIMSRSSTYDDLMEYREFSYFQELREKYSMEDICRCEETKTFIANCERILEELKNRNGKLTEEERKIWYNSMLF